MSEKLKRKNHDLADAYWTGELADESDPAYEEMPYDPEILVEESRPVDTFQGLVRELMAQRVIIYWGRRPLNLPLLAAFTIAALMPQLAAWAVIATFLGWWRIDIKRA